MSCERDAATLGSQGMIRLASRSLLGDYLRIWDVGVPVGNDNDGDGRNYSFVIDDTSLGTTPEFIVRYGTGRVGIGTTNPQAILDVNGTIRSGGYFTTVGDENLRIVRGRVSWQGTRLEGTGFHPQHLDEIGEYQIQFIPPFAGNPTVTASPLHGSPMTIMVQSATPSLALIYAYSGSGLHSPANMDLQLMAIGPR